MILYSLCSFCIPQFFFFNVLYFFVKFSVLLSNVYVLPVVMKTAENESHARLTLLYHIRLIMLFGPINRLLISVS
jgi:hypothetical protein